MTLYVANLRPQTYTLRVRLPEKSQPLLRVINPYGTLQLNLPVDAEKAVIEHLRIYGGRSLTEFTGYRKDNINIKTPLVYHDKEINYDSVQIGVDLVRDTAQQIANNQLADSTATVVKAAEQKTGKKMKDGSGVRVYDADTGEAVAEVIKG